MSFDEVNRRYKEERDEKRHAVRQSMKDVLQNLKKDALQKIIVEYDGHGDEGFIQRIAFVTPEGNQIEKDVHAIDRSPEPLLLEIEDFVFSLLPAGWETNEGSFGTCMIDVRTGKYDLKHVWGQGKPHERA